jgi:hypothetical protein
MFWLSSAYKPIIKTTFFPKSRFICTYEPNWITGIPGCNKPRPGGDEVSFLFTLTVLGLVCYLYQKEFLPCSIHSKETIIAFLSNY